jgi:hypothetical protein
MTRSLMVCLCVVLMAAVSSPPATTTLIVSVGDAGSGAFVVDAEVKLTTIKRSVRTKWDGEARFRDLDRGKYHVQVRAIGFAPGDIDIQVSGDSMGIHFALERIPPTLDTVRVDAERVSLRLAAFETRRSAGIGRFMTDSMLRDDRTRSVQTVLATRFAGLQMKDNGVISMQPSGIRADNECPVLVYLDGMQMENVDKAGGTPAPGRTAGRWTGGVRNDRMVAELDKIRPDELVGIEVYPRTSAPQEYRPLGNYCKVVLLWSRY